MIFDTLPVIDEIVIACNDLLAVARFPPFC